MKRWIERLLNVGPGDLRRGLLLSSCLFLVISTFKIGSVVANALFLSRFQASHLAYADISSAVLVALAVAGYVSISRRVILRDLLVGSMVVFAPTYALFWALAHFYSRLVWISPVLYIWVKAFGVLGATQIWTLANYILTTREAKRVFGMVGSGGIAGGIFAGFLAKTMAKRFGTESLLLAMALLVFICAGLVVLIWRENQAVIADTQETAGESEKTGSRNLVTSMRLMYSSPYLRAIAVVICISSLISQLTNWQFLAIGQYFLVKKDAMAIFFGNFNFYANLLGLLFQLFLTARVLRNFGIGAALFALPTAVLLGSAGLLVFGTLGAAVGLKGSDQVLRYSMDRSTTELLYLPIAVRIKLQVKWFIDTVVWRLGDGLSGIIVLIFATWLHLPARHISWVVLVLTGSWLVSVAVARRQYVSTLKESIRQHRFDVENATAPVLDRSTADLLATNLFESTPKDILYALGLFEVEEQRAAHPAIRALLSHSAPEVRQKAISILSAAGDQSIRPQVERLLKDPAPDVRTEAMFYLTHHAHIDPLSILEELSDFEDFSLRAAVAAFLARPGKTQDLETAQRIFETMVEDLSDNSQRAREEVARLLGTLPRAFFPLLSRLLTDASPLVVRQAIRSAAQMKDPSFVPLLLNYLWHKDHASEAVQALAQYGDSVVSQLDEMLGSDDTPWEIRREIPVVLSVIGSHSAAKALGDHLLEGDSSLRFKIIGALNKLRQQHPEMELDTGLLEALLDAEIFGHYRSYQIIEAVDFPKESMEVVAPALKEALAQELERIFRLLNLLYPQLDFHSVYVGLQSQNKTVHDNALEFLESSLKAQLRAVLVPLLDGKVSSKERAVLAARIVHTTVENREQGVAAMISSEDPWFKSCGAYAIGSLGIRSLSAELDRCFEHPDPLLRETARAAKLRLAEQS
jgi:AAA family ATP:ADP antiporter